MSHDHDCPSKPYRVAIPEQPVTEKRIPYVPCDDSSLVDPGTARVNIAPSREAPEGTTSRDWAYINRNRTVRDNLMVRCYLTYQRNRSSSSNTLNTSTRTMTA